MIPHSTVSVHQLKKDGHNVLVDRDASDTVASQLVFFGCTNRTDPAIPTGAYTYISTVSGYPIACRSGGPLVPSTEEMYDVLHLL